MNYRHAFHAGNHADVFKHMVLLFCLEHLKRKQSPFAVLDTHAGRGRYHLGAEEAARSPEWQGGVGKLWDWAEAPPLVAAYLAALKACAPEPLVYPGSPLLIAMALREQDSCIACELHTEEHAALAALFKREPRVQVHLRDGYEAMGALLPPPARRGLVLIDPPYEAREELENAVTAIKGALKRFAHGVYIWWRPLKDEQALARADAELGVSALRGDLWIDNPAAAARLVGASLLIINAPFTLEAALCEALPPLAKRLAVGFDGWRVSSLSPHAP